MIIFRAYVGGREGKELSAADGGGVERHPAAVDYATAARCGQRPGHPPNAPNPIQFYPSATVGGGAGNDALGRTRCRCFAATCKKSYRIRGGLFTGPYNTNAPSP